jgi:hypothetical protein
MERFARPRVLLGRLERHPRSCLRHTWMSRLRPARSLLARLRLARCALLFHLRH